MRQLFLRLVVVAMLALVLIQVLGMAVMGVRQTRDVAQARQDLVTVKLGWAAQTLASDPDMDLHVLERSLGLRLREVHTDHAIGPNEQTLELESGTLLVAQPMEGPPPPPIGWIILQIVLAASAFGGVLFVLSRPALRDLQTLETVAGRIASGDLSARTGLTDGPVANVGSGFDIMAERIEEILRGQTELLHAVSHELRTPMARMRFLMELLPASDSLTAMDEELQAMDSLLEELLEVLRLDGAPTEPAAPEVTSDVIRDVCERLGTLADVDITVELGGALQISERDLTRVVSNLVTNATRHAANRVLVRLMPGKLVVEDDGPGVSIDDRTRIFEPFHTGDPSRNGQLGGVGLGLTLVRRSVERWGGTVEVDSAETGGARFVVRIPDSST